LTRLAPTLRRCHILLHGALFWREQSNALFKIASSSMRDKSIRYVDFSRRLLQRTQ
jgi:hypothetical protein